MGSGFYLVKSEMSGGELIFKKISNNAQVLRIGDTDFEAGTSITSGLPMDDSNTIGVGLYSELPSTGDALTVSSVIRGSYQGLYLNKAQDQDVDLYAANAEFRMSQNLVDGLHSGYWGLFKQSGTASTTYTSECVNSGVRATFESDNNLTVGTSCVVCGLHIDSLIGSSATMNGDSYGLHMSKGSTSLDFEYGINIEDCISSHVFRIGSSGTVVSFSDSGAPGTAEGYITVYDVTNSETKYIYIYDNKPSG